MKSFWNERYSEPGSAYGALVNEFLRTQCDRFRRGDKVLVVGDGEGRNGVWLAQQGMDVTTVDYSQVGVDKATALAQARGVNINAVCADLHDWQWPVAEFDAVVSVFLHFPSDVRALMHGRMLNALQPGGVLIMEAFNKAQLNYNSGGPPVAEMLFSLVELSADFSDAEIQLLEETVVELSEGRYHVGPAAVVRMVAFAKSQPR